MINAPNKDVRTILDVLHHARKEGLLLPAAVEAYRAELRRSMRVWRKRAREWPNPRTLDAMRGAAERRVADLQRESARVRRLQRRFRSWQAGGTPCS